MNVSTIGYEVLERENNLDCAEFSICPNCSLHIIKLVDGCSVCGWSDKDKLQGGNNKLLEHKKEEYSPHNRSLLFKAISLWQPWASLIGLGLKQYETRSWKTNYRGKLVICSAARKNRVQHQIYETLANKYRFLASYLDLPFGHAIAIADLTDCIEMTDEIIQTISQSERECGDWKVGRYAWKLENIRVLYNSIPVKGKQGLWNIELDENAIVEATSKTKAVRPNVSSSYLQKKPYAKRYSDGQTGISNNLRLGSLSISCIVKQPKQPELKGVIQKDLGAPRSGSLRDRFLVDILNNGSTITVSKLYVYPDFSDVGDKRLLGGLNKSSSNCSSTLDKSSSKNNADFNAKVSDRLVKSSSKIIPPSTKSSSKIRRKKGEGSGHIYYRAVTRNGKNYRQAYYQWRENGKQRTKYIPKKLLKDIEEAEAQKLPVTKILDLLQGGLNKCSSKSFDTSTEVLAKSVSDETINNCSSNFDSPPCNNSEKEGNLSDRFLIKNNEEDSKNRGCSNSKDVRCIDESPSGYRSVYVGTINNCSSNSSNPPSKRRCDPGDSQSPKERASRRQKRSLGYGGGYIEYREVKRNHKTYAQYWYHYEFWSNGRCVEKKSKYIPKRMRSRIERMNRDKVPVSQILRVLESKRK